jgi:hypothetical protein
MRTALYVFVFGRWGTFRDTKRGQCRATSEYRISHRAEASSVGWIRATGQSAWSRRRRARVHREDTACGDDLTAPAQVIADLYRRRWAIELFFRWVKQTLKISRFLGTSENAVRIQVAVALIAFLLLRLAQATQKAVTSPLAFARLVRANLMHKRDLRALLEPDQPLPINRNQLAFL